MTQRGCPPPWRDPRVIGVLLLVFLCGSVSGALLMRFRTRSVSANGPCKDWSNECRNITLQRFRSELNLTDDQAKEVEVVLDDYMKYYHELQEQIKDVGESGRQRVRTLLNDQQKTRFNNMMDEVQRQIR